MTLPSPHPDDWIDLWISGELGDAERRQLEEHFQECERCRGVRNALVATRDLVRGQAVEEPLPKGFEARLAEALDEEDKRPVENSESSDVTPFGAKGTARGGHWKRWLLPLAACVVALLGWWIVGRRPVAAPGVLDAAFAQYGQLLDQGVPPAARSDEAAQVEARWRDAGITFRARVLDLGAMGIELAGGDATRLEGTLAARMYYRGQDAEFICWMFKGWLTDLPLPLSIRHHGGFVFQVYHRGEITVVAWQEGETACALAGRGDPETVVALAYAKAMAPQPPQPVAST